MLIISYMDVSKNGGTQQPWVFLLKMIILGCFGGTLFLETPIYEWSEMGPPVNLAIWVFVGILK